MGIPSGCLENPKMQQGIENQGKPKPTGKFPFSSMKPKPWRDERGVPGRGPPVALKPKHLDVGSDIPWGNHPVSIKPRHPDIG